MDDVKALVAKNSIGLPPEKIAAISNLVARGSLGYLSPDKEAGPFMLFLSGSSLEDVAKATSFPVDVIYLTAMRYNWPEKAEAMRKDKIENGVDVIQGEIVKLITTATYVTLQKQLADIIAGRADYRDCPLLPKNIHGLEKLMNMIESMKPKSQDVQAPVSVSGQNIQINFPEPGSKSKLERLKELNASKE